MVVLAFAARAHRLGASERVRRWATVAATLVVVQIGLGVASVFTVLAVLPVSLHTLVAASLLAVLTHVATVAHTTKLPQPTPVPVAIG